MDHPVIGRLHPAREGGWQAWLSLAAFQPCYERWDALGKERRDTRGADERSGRFCAYLLPLVSDTGPGRGRDAGPLPPSDAQVAAIEYLLKNQDRVAREIGAALVEEAPQVYHWDYLESVLVDVMRRRLATVDGMLQMVELQSLAIGAWDEGGCARVGFSFHSELLEPEHGVAVITLRDRVLVVGTCDDLMDLYGPPPDDAEGEP
jgi:hypothetical protein